MLKGLRTNHRPSTNAFFNIRGEGTLAYTIIYASLLPRAGSYLLQISSNIKPSLDGAVGSAIDCNRLLYHRSVLCSNHSQEIHFCFLLPVGFINLNRRYLGRPCCLSMPFQVHESVQVCGSSVRLGYLFWSLPLIGQ